MKQPCILLWFIRLLFSSLSWISVPEKNIGYEFLFRLRQREIHKGQNYYYFQSLPLYSQKFISNIFSQYVIANLMN